MTANSLETGPQDALHTCDGEGRTGDPRWAAPALFWNGLAAAGGPSSPQAVLTMLGEREYPCYRSLQGDGSISTAGDYRDKVTEHRMSAAQFWREAHAVGPRHPWQLRVRLRDHPELAAFARSLLTAYRPWLPEAPRMEYSAVWLAGVGSRTPLHQDAGNGILVQVAGVKRARLLHPSALSPEDCSRIRASERLLDAYVTRPEKAWAHFRAELSPGSALYIPRGWHHDIVCTAPSISLVLRA
ncbi:cupin-like domain-containing protein [Streptomyces sp. NPDC001137]|uniref:cupin-like domain-containing protein n=1 Tax=Streptomyces sp. NPDC001137 TaxID=3154378 RepID=UPI00331CF3A1